MCVPFPEKAALHGAFLPQEANSHRAGTAMRADYRPNAFNARTHDGHLGLEHLVQLVRILRRIRMQNDNLLIFRLGNIGGGLFH